MDVREPELEHAPPPDLASVVLADVRTGRRGVPEPVPFAPLTGVGAGFDARSVLVLAVVVCALAMAVAATTGTVGPGLGGSAASPQRDTRSPDGAGTTVAATRDAPAARARGGASVGSDAVGPSTVATAPAGVQLAVARLVAGRDGTGAVVRVVVRNDGAAALTTAAGATVALVLDGSVIATRDIGAIRALGGTSAVVVSSPVCGNERHAVTAIIDPRARVREADELDNALARELVVPC